MTDTTTKRRRPTSKRADREAFFVLVEAGDTVAFFNATEHVGREMPFSKPQATCAMRAAGDIVSFSLLRLTKANQATVASKPISMPRGPLARLERRAEAYKSEELDADQIVVEISTRLPSAPRPDNADTSAAADAAATPSAPAPAGDDLSALFDDAPTSDSLADLFADDAPTAAEAPAETASDNDADKPRKRPQRQHRVDTYRCTIRRDENNVAYIEEVDDDTVIEVPRGAVHVSVYMRSPAVDRVLALSFIGTLGKKPGTPETVARVASMALNTATRLTEFRILSAIESVALPASPAGPAPVVNRSAADRAEFPIKLYMFSAELQPLGVGTVVAEIDLENANPASGRLLVKYTPEDSIAEMFPHYRTTVDNAVGATLRTHLGDDQLADITYDVILGGVDAGTVERLREVGAHIADLDVTPTNYRIHE